MLADVDDTRLFCELSSEANETPVLFFHGGLGLDQMSFRPYLDSLGEVAQLMYYDHLCNGRSQHSAGSKYRPLVLSGVNDWITPVKEGGQRLPAGIPNSELIVFEKSGQWPFIEEDRTIRGIKEWLDHL